MCPQKFSISAYRELECPLFDAVACNPILTAVSAIAVFAGEPSDNSFVSTKPIFSMLIRTTASRKKCDNISKRLSSNRPRKNAFLSLADIQNNIKLLSNYINVLSDKTKPFVGSTDQYVSTPETWTGFPFFLTISVYGVKITIWLSSQFPII